MTRDTERDYAALAERVKAAAQPPLSWRVYGQQVTPDGGERYDLLIVRIPARPDASPHQFRVLLNGGTHGDEPAGPQAVVRFLEERRYERWPQVAFTVLPCTNPWGYAHNRREGPGGVDLNRSFRRAGPQTREISQLKRALTRRKFDLFLDCHEDVDAPGLYVFSTETLGRAIVAAAGKVGPLHPGPDVDGQIPLQDSVVVFGGRRPTPQQRSFNAWPLPRYVGRYHVRQPAAIASPPGLDGVTGAPPEVENTIQSELARMRQATIETPTCLPLDQRVAMHHAAIDAALELLTSG